MLVIFVWVSLTGCAAVVGGIEKTERIGSATVDKAVEEKKRELSDRRWDRRKNQHYRFDKATGKRLYEHYDEVEKKWYVVDSTTGERIYVRR